MIWSLAFYGEDRKCVISFVRRHVRFADCFTTILATWSSHLTCSSFLILAFFHQLELAPAPESFPTTGRNLKQPKVLLFSPYSTRCLEMDIPCNLFGGPVPDITGTNEEVEKIVDTIGIGEMVMIKDNADQTEVIGMMRSEVEGLANIDQVERIGVLDSEAEGMGVIATARTVGKRDVVP